MNSEPFHPLETQRLQLRCVAADDAAPTSIMMTPEVSRWIAHWPLPFTLEMAIVRIEGMRKLAFIRDAMPFAVVEKVSNELIGWVVITRDNKKPGLGSLGYWLGEKHHGKGYMKELAPIVLGAAFEWLKLDVIEAAAQPANTGSFKVMQACGMKRAGEGMVYAPARQQEELCYFYEIKRPSLII